MKKVSIVTVVKNDSAGLEKTIKSITAQTFKDYEFIIADGGSDTATLSVAEKYRQHTDIFIEGPDNGIYDAMNKGIAKAHGEYIIFMNAGDVFASDDALEQVFRAVTGRPDIIYGDYMVDYGYTRRHIKAIPGKDIWKGMLTSHQSTLVRRELMWKYPFDISIKIGADFDILYFLSTHDNIFLHVPVTIAVVEPGGVSDRKRVQVYREHFNSVRNYSGLSFKLIIYYAYKITDSFLRQTVKSILPDNTVKRLIKHKADR